jgi:hypothetical protein
MGNTKGTKIFWKEVLETFVKNNSRKFVFTQTTVHLVSFVLTFVSLVVNFFCPLLQRIRF